MEDGWDIRSMRGIGTGDVIIGCVLRLHIGMRKHKLRQVVDVVFGVHDDRAVEIGQRIRERESRLNRAKAELAAARAFVEEQDPAALADSSQHHATEQELAIITASSVTSYRS